MASIINYNGKKYIRWSGPLGPAPVGHIPLSPEDFSRLESRIATSSPIIGASKLSTPALPRQMTPHGSAVTKLPPTGRPVYDAKKNRVRVKGPVVDIFRETDPLDFSSMSDTEQAKRLTKSTKKKTVRPTGATVFQEKDFIGPLKRWELRGGADPSDDVTNVYNTSDLSRTESLGISHSNRRLGNITTSTGELLKEAGFDMDGTPADNIEALRSMSRSSLTELPGEVTDLLRSQIDEQFGSLFKEHAEQISAIREHEKAIERLRGIQGMKELAPGDARHVAVQIRGIEDKLKGLYGQVRGPRSELHQLSSIASKLTPYSSDEQYTFDQLHQTYRDRMEEAFEIDPKFKSTVAAYEREIRSLRTRVSTTDRFFRVVQGQQRGVIQTSRGGERSSSLMEIGDFQDYVDDPLTLHNHGLPEDGKVLWDDIKVKIPEKPNVKTGVWTRDVSLFPDEALGGLRREAPELSRVANNVSWETLPQEFKYLGRNNKDLSVLDAIVPEIDRKVSGAFGRVARGLFGDDFNPDEVAKAKSLFLGTAYSTPSLDSSAEWGMSIDGTDSIGNSLRGMLLNPSDEASRIKRMIYKVAPHLEDTVKRKGEFTSIKDIKDALAKSAESLDIPRMTGRHGDRSEVEGLLRKETRRQKGLTRLDLSVSEMFDTIDDSDRTLPSVEEEALGNVSKSRIRTVTELPEFWNPSDAVAEYHGLLIQHEVLNSVADIRASGKVPGRGFGRAIQLTQKMTPMDLAMSLAGYDAETLERMGVGATGREAYGLLRHHAESALKDTPFDPQTAEKTVRRALKPSSAKEARANRVADFFTQHREKALRRMIKADSLDNDSFTVLDQLFKTQGSVEDFEGISGRNRRRVVDPFVGQSRGHIVSDLAERAKQRQEFSIGGEGFNSKVSIQDIMLDQNPDNKSITVMYQLAGTTEEREQALRNMGVAEESVVEQARRTTNVYQQYEWRSLRDMHDIQFAMSAENTAMYRKYAQAELIKKHPKADMVRIQEMLSDEMNAFRDSGPDELLDIIRGRIGDDAGGFVETAAPRVLRDARKDVFVRDMVSMVGRASTVTADRNSYSRALVDRVMSLKDGHGDPSRMSTYSRASLFQVEKNAQGAENIVLNDIFTPSVAIKSGGSAPIEISSAAKAVQDQIIEGLGGQEEVSKMIGMGTTPVDIPATLRDQVFGAVDGEAYVKPIRNLYPTMAAGNIVAEDTKVDRAYLTAYDDAFEALTGETTHSSSLSIGEHVARATFAAEHPDMGVDSAAYTERFIVNPMKRHAARLASPEVADFVPKVASGAEKIIEEMPKRPGELKQAQIGLEGISKLWEHKSVRYGSVAVAGLAAWGMYRNQKRNKDHTADDIAGPQNLPGGSAYENSPEGFTSMNEGYSPQPTSGVTYKVSANGSFDPNAMSSHMSGIVGGSTSMNISGRQDPIRSRSQKMQSMIDGY